MQIRNLLFDLFPMLRFRHAVCFVLVLNIRKQRTGNKIIAFKHYGFSFMFPNSAIRISSNRTETKQTKLKHMKHHNVHEIVLVQTEKPCKQ